MTRRSGLGDQRCMQGLVGCVWRVDEEKGVNVVDKSQGIFMFKCRYKTVVTVVLMSMEGKKSLFDFNQLNCVPDHCG
jgi:hypothetical protein